VRCEELGYAQGTEKHENCIYVLSKLERADELFEVESSAKCFESAFHATHCVVWYSRVAAGEAMDEAVVKNFNTLMDAKATAEDRCRKRLGKEEMTNTTMGECVAAETKQYILDFGATIDEATIASFNGMSAKSKEAYEDFAAWSKKRYDEAKAKSRELYEGGKEKSGELYEKGKAKSKELHERWNKWRRSGE
jgi:hypothetical protein